jgi:CHAD domain-containing protein
MFDFVFEQLAARVGRVKETVQSTRVVPDAEAIHELRVSIRRLTEAARSLENWVKPKLAAKLRERLRPVMKAAGETRNLDIASELCVESGVPAGAVVAGTLSRMRTEAVHRLIEELLLLDPAKLQPPCEPNPDAPAPKVLGAEILAGMIPQYWQAGDAAARPQAGWTDLHQFRLATKHLRYTIELFAPVYGRGAQSKLDVLKDVQTHLGRVNDCHTARELGPIHGEQELDAWISGRQHSERDKFLKSWAVVRKRSRAGEVWLRYFTRTRV